MKVINKTYMIGKYERHIWYIQVSVGKSREKSATDEKLNELKCRAAYPLGFPIRSFSSLTDWFDFLENFS